MNAFINPYEGMGACAEIKTNFHTHAGVCKPGECGVLPLDDVVEAYAAAGYGALAISNHDRYLPRDRTYADIGVLDAVEYSATPHMLLIGVNRPDLSSHQEAIDAANRDGGFVILCHPNWIEKEYWKWDKLDETSGFTGIEILNSVIFRLSGSGLALDSWDHLLSRGRRVFGFGNDDFHRWHDLARAYNMIFARSSAFEDIKEAVLAGRFYVSNGVRLKWLDFREGLLRLEATYSCPTYIKNFEYRFIGQGGRVLDVQQSQSACYRCRDDDAYVRVEVTAECGAKMYLQPFFNERFLVE